MCRCICRLMACSTHTNSQQFMYVSCRVSRSRLRLKLRITSPGDIDSVNWEDRNASEIGICMYHSRAFALSCLSCPFNYQEVANKTGRPPHICAHMAGPFTPDFNGRRCRAGINPVNPRGSVVRRESRSWSWYFWIYSRLGWMEELTWLAWVLFTHAAS